MKCYFCKEGELRFTESPFIEKKWRGQYIECKGCGQEWWARPRGAEQANRKED